MKTQRQSVKKTVRTTIDMPESVWQAAKIRAVQERTDLRSVILAALAAYLKKKPGKERGR